METKKYKILMIFIVIFSLMFKIVVIEKTPVNDNTQIDSKMGIPKTLEDYDKLYDLDTYGSDENGHLYYIMYLYNNHELCDNTNGQTYHPPLHYIISSIWLNILDIFHLDSMQKIEGLQYIGLIYFMISILLVYKILERVDLSEESKIIIILLYCFHPKFIKMSTLITNDFLVYIFELLSLLYLMKWFKNTSFKNAILLASITGLGCLAKANCITMVIPIGICYLIKMIDKIKNKEDISIIVFEGIIFWVILITLALAYPIRCIIDTRRL